MISFYANSMEQAKEAYGKVVRAYQIQEKALGEAPMVKGAVRQ